MMIGTFKGGIHPDDGKALSKSKPITLLEAGNELVFPVSQHIGAPATPIVKVGDSVLVGQIIAQATGFVSANVVSSVSGKVKAIEGRLTVSGSKVMSIVVENDKRYETVKGFGNARDYTKLTADEIRDIVKEAGIVGMGGAGFPTHVKLAPKDPEKIDTIIVNGAECEPYLTSDYRVMKEAPQKIISGLKVMLSMFPSAKGFIGVEDNKPDCIRILAKMVEKENNIEVVSLKTKYPQGAERQLICAVTGRKINASMLPADVGCIVDNVDTVVSIHNAVCESTPLIRRIITVTGDAICDPRNFEVRTGVPYSLLIESAGGFKKEPAKIISGGPMMGNAIYDIDIPVTKNSSALLALSKDEVAGLEPSACIRCGKCVTACPSGLVPVKMYDYSTHFDEEAFEKINGMECYECGCCTYVCPAKRPMTQAFRQTRRSIMAKRRKK